MRLDCFALNDKRQCTVLINQPCATCKFYKTREQFERDRSAAYMRIQSLPLATMMDIEAHYPNRKAQE
jgi:hypothetical protein